MSKAVGVIVRAAGSPKAALRFDPAEVCEVSIVVTEAEDESPDDRGALALCIFSLVIALAVLLLCLLLRERAVDSPRLI